MDAYRTQKLILIFEAVNETLRESFVGATSMPLAMVRRLYESTPPPAIAHWRPEHKVSFLPVEAGMSAQESAAFIPAYAKAAHYGWKTYIDPQQ
jgi:hypothetical protein